MAKKLKLDELLNPFIKRETAVFTINGEEHEIEFGIRPPSDQFDFAQIEVLEKIQQELGWSNEEMDEYSKQQDEIAKKVNAKIEKLLKDIENPTIEQRIEARMKVRYEDFPYTTRDTKYNMRWNKYIIPLQIRYLVVNPETGEPLFDNDDKILALPKEMREAISEKVDAYLISRRMGVIEAKK
jgi:hypothetical protein